MPEYVYHDRKMMKWMPFNALLEQGDHIRILLKGKEEVEMPLLSQDLQDELNYNLSKAYYLKQFVRVTYYKLKQFHQITGTIERIDTNNKLIFINTAPLSAYQITDIELI
jgi:hypothetical protein